MVFKGVKYYLPETLPEERRSELAGLLQQHNATRADSAFDATHIITNSDAFEEWRDVNSEEAAVVSDLWVERSIAANKIQNPSFYSASRSKIFSGVVACSADLRASDEEVISVGITSLGGQWRMGLTKDVTHLFAMSTTSEKYHTGMQYRDQTNIKVLVPDWFDHAVLFGNSGLSTDTYEWPDPSVLSRRPTVSPAQLEKAKRQQRLSMSPQKKALYKTAAWDPSKPKLQSKGVWGGYRILLSSTLELTGSRRQIVEAGIREAQGVPLAYSGDGTSKEELRLLDNCDVFITRYRTGDAFLKAWRRGTKIGTLSWLLNAQVTGVQTSPLDQILHFPIPAGAVQGFDKHEISVTNYTGEARDYLKKLITLMGGSFTPSLSIKNTVLVAAQMSGSKTAKAAEWSIPVVNHTWLEDCFLRWQCLTPALPKYISYPPGVDFSSILGTRGIGPDITEIAAKEGWDGGEEEQEQEKEKEKEKAGLSQNSADETEVEGGLMPPADVDMDVDMDYGGGADDADLDTAGQLFNSPAPSFEDAPPFRDASPSSPSPRRGPAGPSTSKAPSSAAKPASPRRRKRIRGVSTSSESQFDPEITKKVVHIKRPPSAAKPTPKRKGKAREEPEAEVSHDEDAEARKKAAVGARPRPRPLPKGKARAVESEAEASQPDEEEERPSPPKRVLARRTGPPPKGRKTESEADASDHAPVLAKRTGPPPKTAKRRDADADAGADSEAPASQDDDDDDEPVVRPARKPLVRRVTATAPVPVPVPTRQSPRKAAPAPSPRALRALPASDSGSNPDDLPVQLAPPPKTQPKPKPKPQNSPGGLIKAARLPPSPPKRQPAAKARAATPEREPPSSPLSAPPSARRPRRVEVVVPDVKSLAAAVSARKAPPPARTQSISAVGQHRATPLSARAAASASTSATRVSSPPSSVAPEPEPAVGAGGRAQRSAAARATQRLHDEIMPDVVNYQNEMRGSRGRKSLPRRVSGPEPREEEEEEEEAEEGPRARRVRPLRPPTSDGESERPRKKPRRSEVALRNGKPIKLMTTGLQTPLSDDVLKALADLGAKVTGRATDCTHLVVAKLVRTEKFLCALAGAPFILTEQWALDSARAGELMPEEDYLLHDAAGESKYGFRLADALARARALKGALFKGHVFYLMPRVPTDPALLRSVVLANGGQLITNQQPTARALGGHEGRHVIGCKEDDAAARKAVGRVYSQEVVLTSALKQEVDWEGYSI